jgi:autotransporter strand-loop-strand O-heptosyltransferase
MVEAVAAMDQQLVEPPSQITESTSSAISTTVSVTPVPASSDAPASAQQATQKPHHPLPAATPTQFGPEGIRFDFNQGARLFVPAREGVRWVSTIRDLDTGNVLFTADRTRILIRSTKQYYVRFGLEIQDESGAIVFSHDYDAADQKVLISLPLGTLGDSLGWMPYAARFAAVHRCALTVALAERLIPLFQDAYQDITFVTHEAVHVEEYYATYNIGLFFDDATFERQPTDFRHVGLHRTAGYILGVDPDEEPARICISDKTRPIPERYVVIAVQASTHAKKWNNPFGWYEVIDFLKKEGYRVICIDRDRVHGAGNVWTHIPHGVEDETGERPLVERARWLKHASAFIGASSGLAWLAWSVGCPVVLVSGFTHPTNEFHTEGRVINYHACNSCWNDVRHRFEHNDFLWCPRHKNTDRAFECSRFITGRQVIESTKQVLARTSDTSPIGGHQAIDR